MTTLPTPVTLYESKPRQAYIAMSTSSSTSYTLRRTPKGWMCSCPGFTYRATCKHVTALATRAEREGWALGPILPLDRLTRETPPDDTDSS